MIGNKFSHKDSEFATTDTEVIQSYYLIKYYKDVLLVKCLKNYCLSSTVSK